MRLSRLGLLMFAAALLLANAPLAYRLDTRASEVTAKVAFIGIASKTAGFPRMSGSVSIVPDDPGLAKIDVVLDARALTAPDKVTLERLRGEKFFWVERYPTVRFTGERLVMRDARRGEIKGTLTARGVSRPETLLVTFERPPAQATGGQPITLSGRMQIDRREYGMTAYSLIVGRTVDIRLTARMIPA